MIDVDSLKFSVADRRKLKVPDVLVMYSAKAPFETTLKIYTYPARISAYITNKSCWLQNSHDYLHIIFSWLEIYIAVCWIYDQTNLWRKDNCGSSHRFFCFSKMRIERQLYSKVDVLCCVLVHGWNPKIKKVLYEFSLSHNISYKSALFWWILKRISASKISSSIPLY